jgi:hypothetical protein
VGFCEVFPKIFIYLFIYFLKADSCLLPTIEEGFEAK